MDLKLILRARAALNAAQVPSEARRALVICEACSSTLTLPDDDCCPGCGASVPEALKRQVALL